MRGNFDRELIPLREKNTLALASIKSFEWQIEQLVVRFNDFTAKNIKLRDEIAVLRRDRQGFLSAYQRLHDEKQRREEEMMGAMRQSADCAKKTEELKQRLQTIRSEFALTKSRKELEMENLSVRHSEAFSFVHNNLE